MPHSSIDDILQALCQRANAPSASAAKDGLSRYAAELRHYAPRLNIVSLTDLSRLTEHHLLPALFIAEEMALHPNYAILDVGSGGGLPAIPLAITHPRSVFTLVEARRRRANFLRHVVRILALQNVTVINARVEDIDIPPQDIALSRAVGGLQQLRHAAGCHLQPHGLFITTETSNAPNRLADHRFHRTTRTTQTTIIAQHLVTVDSQVDN